MTHGVTQIVTKQRGRQREKKKKKTDNKNEMKNYLWAAIANYNHLRPLPTYTLIPSPSLPSSPHGSPSTVLPPARLHVCPGPLGSSLIPREEHGESRSSLFVCVITSSLGSGHVCHSRLAVPPAGRSLLRPRRRLNDIPVTSAGRKSEPSHGGNH